MTTAIKLSKGQPGGFALAHKYGQEHMRITGSMGGRPRALTVKDIIPEAALANRNDGRGQRHGKSLKELLRLWRERQAASDIRSSGAACLHNGQRSSLEDSQHLGVGEPDYSPKNNPLQIKLPSNSIPTLSTTIPTTHFDIDPDPQRGGGE